MKKIYLLVAISGLLTFTDARAQRSAQKRPKIGVGADFAFPTGDFEQTANYGIGGSLLYQHPVANHLNVTFNVGYLRFNGDPVFGDIKYKQGFVPFKGGARFLFAGNFYLTGEAGVVISTANGYGSGTSFVYAPGLGGEFTVGDGGSIELGLRYEGWARSNGTISFAGIRAGYNF